MPVRMQIQIKMLFDYSFKFDYSKIPVTKNISEFNFFNLCLVDQPNTLEQLFKTKAKVVHVFLSFDMEIEKLPRFLVKIRQSIYLHKLFKPQAKILQQVSCMLLNATPFKVMQEFTKFTENQAILIKMSNLNPFNFIFLTLKK
ncbi:hypothetical protein BpHYR1_043013 [Brachionus plicatilis]|uniref:Uncharacterized protein n=1 Tax=Brachionus plicatilis TaxID=10195 RepID=A0A3M7QKP5_BRAPC|nr:hypothetical protein BpHYR1_043013 [Brachionus plicatilis]